MPTKKQVLAILNDYEETDSFFVFTKKLLGGQDEDAEMTQYNYLKLMSYYLSMRSLPASQSIRDNISAAWARINELSWPFLGESFKTLKGSDLKEHEHGMSQLINEMNRLSSKSQELLKSHSNAVAALLFYLELKDQNISIPLSLEHAIFHHPNIVDLTDDWWKLKSTGCGTQRNLVLLVHEDQPAKELQAEHRLYHTAAFEYDHYVHLYPEEMGEEIATLIKQNPKHLAIEFINTIQQIKFANKHLHIYNRKNEMTTDEAEEERRARHSLDPFSLTARFNEGKAELDKRKKQHMEFRLMTTAEKVDMMAAILKEDYHPDDWTESDILELKKPILAAMHEAIDPEFAKIMEAQNMSRTTSNVTLEQNKTFEEIEALTFKISKDLKCRPSERVKLGYPKEEILDRELLRESKRFSKTIDQLKQGVKTLDEAIPQINTFMSFCRERKKMRQSMQNELGVSGSDNNIENSTQSGDYREQLSEIRLDEYYDENFKQLEACVAVLIQDFSIDDHLDDLPKVGGP